MDDSSLFIIPKDMERIYICGYLDTPLPEILTIHLYQNGTDRAFYGTTYPKPLKTGLFIFGVIPTNRLKPGEYRADIHVIRDKPAASVHFLIQKLKTQTNLISSHISQFTPAVQLNHGS